MIYVLFRDNRLSTTSTLYDTKSRNKTNKTNSYGGEFLKEFDFIFYYLTKSDDISQVKS